MPAGINVSFRLQLRPPLMERMSLFWEQISADYFRPHTARVHAAPTVAPAGQKRLPAIVKAAGGFEPWTEMERYSAETPVFALLPAEQVDAEHLWTTTQLPPCQDVICDWLRKYAPGAAMFLFVFGELRVVLDSAIDLPGIGPRPLFRCLVPRAYTGSNAFAVEGQNYFAKALLSIRYTKILGQSDVIFMSIGSLSDMWLESGTSFRGAARGAVAENTSALAEQIARAVSLFGDLVEDVVFDGVEKQRWFAEIDRIQAAFQIVPGIYFE